MTSQKKKTKPQIKCKCNTMFFCMQFSSPETSWLLEVSTWCLKFLTLERRKRFTPRWGVVCKVLSYSKILCLIYKSPTRLCLWFKCSWSHSSEYTVFIWDGKLLKFNKIFWAQSFFCSFFPPLMILKPWILILWAAPIVLWQRRAYLPEVGVTVTVYEQTTQNLAKS